MKSFSACSRELVGVKKEQRRRWEGAEMKKYKEKKEQKKSCEGTYVEGAENTG